MTTVTFDALLGQEGALDQIRRAGERPGHAYLVAGPHGAAVADAGRALATVLVAADRDARAVELVARRAHPDVLEFEPEKTVIGIDQVRGQIIPEAFRAPIEAPRKVLLVLEAERLNAEAASALLKTLEEPPPRTVLVLVSDAVDELLDTVRSRCQRIDLVALGEDAVVAALEHAGVARDDAQLAARLGGGHLSRAREMLGDGRALRDEFVRAAERIDGTGAAASAAAADMLTAVQAMTASMRERFTAELEAFDAEAERAGYGPRDLRRQRRSLVDRQPMRERLARRKALAEGIVALETLYRDALGGSGAPLRNLDRTPLAIDARAGARALDACRQAREALQWNPNEHLLLERLVLDLPAVARVR